MRDVFGKCIILCNKFQNGDFGIAEFQSRLGTMQLPDVMPRDFDDNLHNAIEEPEEIIYCYSDPQQKMYGYEIAEKLKQSAKAELDNPDKR